MSGFPQREAVSKLADEEDPAFEEENVCQADELSRPFQADLAKELHQEIVQSRDAQRSSSSLLPSSDAPSLPRARATLEDDDGGYSHAADPLGSIMEWLAFADLGADDPHSNLSSRTLEPSSPSASTSRSSSRYNRGDLASRNNSSRDVDPPVFNRGHRKSAVYCGFGDADVEVPGVVAGDPEEEEWLARQRQTGAAGRLVSYDLDERPQKDFHLRGGGNRRLIVSSVMRGGKAEHAGVKSGDVLVSIDGRKDFAGLSADTVHRRIRAPVTIVFMGFVGKLQAEVRLNNREHVCGLSSQDQVAVGRPEAPLQFVEEVVFQPTSASLFLAVEAQPQLHSSNNLLAGLSPGDDGEVADAILDDELDELGVEFTGPILAAALKDTIWGSDAEDSKSSKAQPGALFSDGRQETADVGVCASERSQSQLVVDGGPELDLDAMSAMTPRLRPGEEQPLSAVYELRGQDARKMVNQALLRARSSASPDKRDCLPAKPSLGPATPATRKPAAPSPDSTWQ